MHVPAPKAAVGTGASLVWTALVLPTAQETDGPRRALKDAIVVVGDDACGDAAALAMHASAWLGTPTIDERIAIEVRGTGFRIWNGDELRGQRALVLDGLDCANQQAALGLAIAFAIDAAVLDSITEPAFVPVSPSKPPQIAPPVVAAVPRVRARVRGTATAHLGAGIGLLSRASFGADVSAEVGPAPWLDVVVSGMAMRGLDAELGAGRVGAWLGLASVSLCPRRRFGRTVLRWCGGVATGAVRATGVGYRNDHTVVLFHSAIVVGATARVGLIPTLALDFELRAYAPVTRTRIEVLERGQLLAFDLPSVGVMSAVGLAFTFRE